MCMETAIDINDVDVQKLTVEDQAGLSAESKVRKPISIECSTSSPNK